LRTPLVLLPPEEPANRIAHFDVYLDLLQRAHLLEKVDTIVRPKEQQNNSGFEYFLPKRSPGCSLPA